MNTHEIDLTSILAKGNVIAEHKDSMLSMTTTSEIPTHFDKEHLQINSYIYLPHKYKLPLRIDITAKLDTPGLYLLLGNGHINVGTPWSDNRRLDDIVEPNHKPKFFHNHIQMNEFANISLLYNLHEMQILINGEERYYSKKERYMKSALFQEINADGFEFKIACSKRTDLTIKSISITEYDENARIVHSENELPAPFTTNKAVQDGQKPTFESCISLLPKEIQSEIIKTDEYLRFLKLMKFKRQIEKYGNKITYLSSDYGFSYAVFPSNDVMHHALQWYIITSSKPELWHRKADRMEETLNKLAQTEPEFAEQLFFRLKECVGCSSNCAVRTLYQFNGKKKMTCHGAMNFKMCVQDFYDVRKMIGTIKDILSEESLIH